MSGVEAMSGVDTADRFVRVFTGDRALEAINGDIVRAVHAGRRALVRAGTVAEGLAEKPDGDKGAVADWAEVLSRENGLSWRRVGQDVLFERPGPT